MNTQKKKPKTLPSGKHGHPKTATFSGKHHSAKDAQDGTSNAAPCPCTIWAKPSTSTAAESTTSSPTTKTKSPKAKPQRESVSCATGSTTNTCWLKGKKWQKKQATTTHSATCSNADTTRLRFATCCCQHITAHNSTLRWKP